MVVPGVPSASLPAIALAIETNMLSQVWNICFELRKKGGRISLIGKVFLSSKGSRVVDSFRVVDGSLVVEDQSDMQLLFLRDIADQSGMQ